MGTLLKALLASAILGLAGCDSRIASAFIEELAKHPRVCLSDVKMVRADDRVAFYPVVHNVGVDNSSKAFHLRQVTRLEEVFVNETQFDVPAIPVVEGKGSSGNSSGPQFAIEQSHLKLPVGTPTGPENDPAAAFVPYVGGKIYRVDAELTSGDPNFNIASQGCTLITRYFRNGGQL